MPQTGSVVIISKLAPNPSNIQSVICQTEIVVVWEQIVASKLRLKESDVSCAQFYFNRCLTRQKFAAVDETAG
jgi:hypothetical protein